MSKTSYTPDSIKAQATEILVNWGMSADNVALTAEGMLDCDLRGIDTHGISLLALYDKWRQTNCSVMGRPTPA
jgi:LDH2 family malate/lactate/ureidoglycolate dehydrogenase